MFWLHWQNWRWHLLSLSCLFWKLVWPVHVYLILLRNFNGYVGSLVRCACVARKKHLLTWKIVNLCFSLYIVISYLSFIGIESAKKKGNACTNQTCHFSSGFLVSFCLKCVSAVFVFTKLPVLVQLKSNRSKNMPFLAALLKVNNKISI